MIFSCIKSNVKEQRIVTGIFVSFFFMNKTSNKITSDLSVSIHKGPSKNILKLLESTTLGTPGKLRYKQTEVEKNTSLLKNLEFIQIKKRDRVLGTAGIIKRKISFKDQTIDSLYVRYLSVYNPIKRTKTKRTPSTVSPFKTGSLRNQITSIFSDELEKSFIEHDKEGIFYAYVESDNIHSKNLCLSFGFKKARSVFTVLFSRLFPKQQTNVFELKKDELGLFKENVASYYSDHNSVFTDHIEDHGTCYVFKENDTIIAGIRAIPINWKIVEMPGFKGFLIQKILPKLPVLNKIFNPEHLRFLAFDSMWEKNEFQPIINILMEHACAKTKINMGMIWGDSESKLINSLLTSGKLGFLHKINGTVGAELLVRSINMKTEDKTQLSKKPTFISAVDMT
ncbi:MAG: hypothetical protein ABJM22_16615 [Balneola sp.]